MIGTPLKKSATRLLMLGCGELGKEVVIEAQRFGIETIAVDRYADAPAMQVAHRSHVANMLDREALERIIKQEAPDLIVPEIEAIDTAFLLELEQQGYRIIPTARATNLTMNREGIRRLAAEELELPTARYRFASSYEEFRQGIEDIGLPCVVKPIMSSSGKGQSTVKSADDIDKAWDYARQGARGAGERVIIEAFIAFDYEITLLTVRHIDGTSYCPPIGHRQEGGDYQESWQPMPMTDKALAEAQRQARVITEALGGAGIFGVEFFIQGDRVFFSEVSPRPHDTGMVTMVTQNMSEFELHVRAILGLPIPAIELLSPGASHVVLASDRQNDIRFSGVEDALRVPGSKVRLFGKPDSRPGRRMGVALVVADSVDSARQLAKEAAARIKVEPAE
ncbi:MAG: formate-dependent phosphoribosylglycinamide formyltransferase [Syntrophotalea acetylenica]|jgi:phosphoribosylglycinamide formyltransferase 2|nr:formate-dependent phosphoribosylglycinamide formyltransferase [Syntrophotalea acetylenica]